MDFTNIFKSKVRKELFLLYFSDTDKKYYLRQLERILNIPVSIIRKELMKLDKSGMFISEKVGNLVYYCLNKSYPLFAELKSIVFKTIGIKGSIQAVLSKIDGIQAAFIYGSFANESERSHSDIDLFIIGKIEEDKLLQEITGLEKKINREINYSLYSESDWRKKKKEKNSFVIDVIENSKIFLIGGKDDL